MNMEMKINVKKFIRSIENGSGKYKIYAILSLETYDVIYVGQTAGTLGNRLSNHKTYLNDKNIGIMLITNTDIQSDESKYIKLFKDLGFYLLNKNGGIREKFEIIDKIKLSEDEKKLINKEKSKKYYQENKERLIKKMKEYQENNLEKQQTYRREYYKSKNKLEVI